MNSLDNCQHLSNDSLAMLEAALDAALAGANASRPIPPAVPVMPVMYPSTLAARLIRQRKFGSNPDTLDPAQSRAARALKGVGSDGCLVKGSGGSTHTLSPTAQPASPTPPTGWSLQRPTPWRKASADDKFLHSIRVAQAHGGLFWSLNLNPSQERRTAASADPVVAFRRRLQRAFQSAGLFVPPFAFVLETSPSGRTHVHGVIIPQGLSSARLSTVLGHAGGKITGKAGSRQVGFRTLYDADGCRNYMMADAEHTRRALGAERLTFMSADLRRLTEQAWKGASV